MFNYYIKGLKYDLFSDIIKMKGTVAIMPKEKITVTVAGVKMNLVTANAHEVRRLAASLDARINRLCKRARCSKNEALVMLTMEQADGQKKSVELIHSQQEQIFTLLAKNASLMGNAEESALYEPPENAILRENAALQQKNRELLDEILDLKQRLGDDW